jgi:hypothetical protein
MLSCGRYCRVSNTNIGIQFWGVAIDLRYSFIKRGYFRSWWEQHRVFKVDDLTPIRGLRSSDRNIETFAFVAFLFQSIWILFGGLFWRWPSNRFEAKIDEGLSLLWEKGLKPDFIVDCIQSDSEKPTTLGSGSARSLRWDMLKWRLNHLQRLC